MSVMSESCGKVGRPRCTVAREKILGAAFEVLAELGWGGMRMELVAAKAGVSKATIYRWWKSREELALEAFLEGACSGGDLPDTGCLVLDIEAQILHIGQSLAGESGRVTRAVLAACQEDPELMDQFKARWEPLRIESFDVVVLRAVERGQLPEGTDAGLLFEAVFGPVFMMAMFGKVPTVERVRPIVMRVLSGFGFVEPDLRCGNR